MDKLLKAGAVKGSEILAESAFFNERDTIPTTIPILNIALQGKLDGGVTSGLTVISGESKTFKTMVSFLMARAYQQKYPDSVIMYYDTEFGSTPANLKAFGIDITKVIHIPIEHIEQLKFDISKRMEQISKGDHVFILIDSVGAVPSKKEVEDALDEKSVADMTRAKALRSMFRIVTPHLTIKDIPCIAIAHTYKTLELYSRDVIGGGTSIMYSANNAWVITKSQEKDADGDIKGWNFNIKVVKSRFVREQTKLSFLVTYEGGISKTSGLMDLATEVKALVSPTKGWYSFVDLDTGEIIEKKYRAKDLLEFDLWKPLLAHPIFNEAVAQKYQVSYNMMIQDESDDQPFIEE